MKNALKYGLSITMVVVIWIVVVRHLMGVGPESGANLIAPVLFNLAQIVGIFMGVIRRKTGVDGELSFKDTLKTGVGISFVYAVYVFVLCA
jgi:hypothetical protein